MCVGGGARGLCPAFCAVGCRTAVLCGMLFPFPPPATSNRACGSPAPGSPTPFTGGMRFLPPGLVSPGRDDDSRHADQAIPVGREVDDRGQAEAPPAFVPPPHEDRQPRVGIVPYLDEAG